MKTAALVFVALLSSVVAAKPITSAAAAMSSAQEGDLFARNAAAVVNERAALMRGPKERGYASASEGVERRDGRMEREERGRDKKKGRVEGGKGKKGKGGKSVKNAE